MYFIDLEIGQASVKKLAFTRCGITHGIAGLAVWFISALAGCASSAPPLSTAATRGSDASVDSIRGLPDELNALPARTQNKSVRGVAERQNASAIAETDSEVLSVVLADLLFQQEGTVAFARKAIPYPVTIDELLDQNDKVAWANLTRPQIEACEEAAEQLTRRIVDNFLFESLEPPDERIQIDEHASGNILNGPVQAWPPGYSTDGRFAVVRLVIPWSFHHKVATYLLSKENDKWSICLRQTVYYQ
jgi:hypothetical protein